MVLSTKLMEALHVEGLQAWCVCSLYIFSLHFLVEPPSSDCVRWVNSAGSQRRHIWTFYSLNESLRLEGIQNLKRKFSWNDQLLPGLGSKPRENNTSDGFYIKKHEATQVYRKPLQIFLLCSQVQKESMENWVILLKFQIDGTDSKYFKPAVL